MENEYDISSPFSTSLKDIDISNNEDEYLLADSTFGELFSISFFSPLFIIIIGFILSTFSFYEDFYKIRFVLFSSNNNSNYYQGSFLSPLISSWNRHLYVIASFSKYFDNQFINGYLDLVFKRNGLIVSEYHSPIFQLDTTKPFQLFISENLAFSQVQGNFRFSNVSLPPSSLNLLWVLGSINYSNFYLIIRIIYSSFIFLYFLNLLGTTQNPEKNSDQNSQYKETRTLVQSLTLFLLILVFLYCIPLILFHYLNPSSFYLYLSVFLRDLAFSYSAFYILSIFSSFSHQTSYTTKENLTIQRAAPLFLPYSFSVFLFVTLLIVDFRNSFFKKIRLFPSKIDFYDSVTIFHCYSSLIFLIIFNVYAWNVKKNISNSQINKWNWYFYLSEIYLFILVLFLYLHYFDVLSYIEGTLLIKVIPISLITAYSLFMSKIHQKLPHNYIQYNPYNVIDDNQIGAEEEDEKKHNNDENFDEKNDDENNDEKKPKELIESLNNETM